MAGEMADDEWERCGNCQFPMSPEERLRDRRICDECVEAYAIDEWEAQR